MTVPLAKNVNLGTPVSVPILVPILLRRDPVPVTKITLEENKVSQRLWRGHLRQKKGSHLTGSSQVQIGQP